ncbi:MAG: D-glycero-beta-D-manno-heptose-7-phosphate kinase [Elusimicrobia bacterium]|nr:D-glycero-beta-D-manno-heptose-7-phosphate kinase [Candidatus Liberimonas magnetica]
MNRLIKFIPEFKKQKILVIGDLMVDKFVWGKVTRISPEAPVPVVLIDKETYALGGAGNVANNLRSLGSEVFLFGVIGKDSVGDDLKKDFIKNSINIKGIISDDFRPTSIKTRIIAAHQQVVRVDKELKGELDQRLNDELISRLETIISMIDAIIISDYGKGVINKTVLKKTISLAHKCRIPVTVDPKIEHFLSYKKVTCITPNQAEAIAGMRYKEVTKDRDILDLGNKILRKLQSETVLITLGEKGMTLFEHGNRITHIPTRAKEVFDVTGAGDTVIATFTLAIASGANFREAAEIANFAAGLVVAKLGTATVTPEELKLAIQTFK